MPILSAYILREVIRDAAIIFALTFSALLLERSVRAIEAIGPSEKLLSFAFQMMANLVPIHFGEALPVAFFTGVLLTFNRLKRDNELDILHSSGIGLHQLLLPVTILSIVVSVITALLFGYLQPHGLYQYRDLELRAAQSSLSERLKVGTFIQKDDTTYYVEDASRGIEDLGKIFAFEETEDGKEKVLTASRGLLGASDDNLTLYLMASDGELVVIAEEPGSASILKFDRTQWKLATFTEETVSPRGSKSSKELTLPELWAVRHNPPGGIERKELVVDIHYRVAQIVSVMILPLIAIPLALGASRVRRASGVVIGIVIVFIFQQMLEFGDGLASGGVVSPWISIWGSVAILAVMATVLFPSVAFKIGFDPYSVFSNLYLSIRDSDKIHKHQ